MPLRAPLPEGRKDADRMFSAILVGRRAGLDRLRFPIVTGAGASGFRGFLAAKPPGNGEAVQRRGTCFLVVTVRIGHGDLGPADGSQR